MTTSCYRKHRSYKNTDLRCIVFILLLQAGPDKRKMLIGHSAFSDGESVHQICLVSFTYPHFSLNRFHVSLTGSLYKYN